MHDIAIGVGTIICLYIPLALGTAIVFRVARFPDLTIDGSFPLGAAICAVALQSGHVAISLPAAALAGFAAGCITAALHEHLGISRLLSGIITMTALYSINLHILGSANIQLIDYASPFSTIEGDSGVFMLSVLLGCAALLVVALYAFLKSPIGLAFRACGQNPRLVRNVGQSRRLMVYLGPGLGNSLIALSGGCIAAYQGFADVTMGIGTLIAGLAYVFIGGALLPSRRPLALLLSPIIGLAIFQVAISVALRVGLSPYNVKAAMAVLLLAGLLASRLRHGRRKMEEVL